jgi:hypothetical protein
MARILSALDILRGLAAIALSASLASCATRPPPLLIAPMIHGADLCQLPATEQRPSTEQELAKRCLETGRSAAPVIEPALAAFGSQVSGKGSYEIGYTLPIPLLKLLKEGKSGWEVDDHAVERFARTVSELDRPVVLHLFSTHFAVQAPIEPRLAKDPSNLSVSPFGPMPKDRYYDIDIYPWSLASTQNDITRYRRLAIERVLEAMCRLPKSERERVRAVTLLGEVHHFHADFERGMGVQTSYIVSDYSENSIQGFRLFLAERFGDIRELNVALGEEYNGFDEVDPPGLKRDVDATRPSAAHIDSAAHGKLPLLGWAHAPSNGSRQPVTILIFRDGTLIARAPARYGRQDVLQAMPSVGTADVGWRYDMDFTKLEPGFYRLDFLAERADGDRVSLGTRRIAIVDRHHSAPSVRKTIDTPAPAGSFELQGSIDHPAESAAFYFNPLVPLWHEYRNAQVSRYLASFAQQVRDSCMGNIPLYTHQIAPFVNPSWDATRFAVETSLREPPGLNLGISLYGEPIYGYSFFDWLESTKHLSYGITEFHPLKTMSAGEIRSVLDRHRARGAVFVSFFLDARPVDLRDPAAANIFALDPDNRQFGSDQLYHVFRAALQD